MTDKKETQMPVRQPLVGANPRAAGYQSAVQARAGGAGLTKSTSPRGGPQTPIPRLDVAAVEGRTMAQNATAQRQAPPSQGIFQGAPSPSPTPQSVSGIRAQDLLPPEAQTDPEFIQGTGSMYATAQPHLAARYGVIRGGQRVAPQSLQTGGTAPPPGVKPPLRRPVGETVADLQKLEDMRTQGEAQVAGASGKGGAESAQGAADIGARMGPKVMTTEEIKEKIDNLDEFDRQTLHEMYVNTLLNNPEQRKIVEERLAPMDLSELVVNYAITQKIPIIPGSFEPMFQSITADDDLALKRMVVEEAKTLKVDDRYLMDKFSVMGMACALHSINGKPFHDHRGEDGKFDEQNFWKKYEQVSRMPLAMLASLGAHYHWFDLRVRLLFKAESIKNG